MKQVNIWENNSLNSLITYMTDIDEITNYIKENNKTSFSVIDKNGLQDGVITTYFINSVSENTKEQNVVVTYVDENHPFFYDNLGDIYFSKEFFNKNKDIIIRTIEDLLFTKENIHISKYVYSDALAKNLCLTATSISFDEDIKVPEEVKKIFKDNRINAYQNNGSVREQISTNQILGQNYNNVISDSNDVYINDDITDLENLKYIPAHKTIHIKQVNMDKEDAVLLENYDGLYNIISKLRENGQQNLVEININNRKRFSESKLYKSDFDNIKIIGIDLNIYYLKDLKEEDKILNLMIKDIKNSDYSLFEKYIAAYNIVKRFKEYLENEKDKTESRKISKFLNNNYMVCVGYAGLLRELLTRLEIPTYSYSVSIDISYDEGFSIEEKPVEFGAHARVIVNLNDPKYGINGFYVADPTWDNDLENDYYNHALMSFDKTSYEKRMFRLSDEELIMNAKSMEDFSFKVNFLIDRNKANPFYSNYSEKEKETSAIESLVNTINSILISLLPEKYLELKKQYPNLSVKNTDVKVVNEFITKAGEIFINNLGKDVLISTVIDAAGVINKDVFGFDEKKANTYKEFLLEDNKSMDKLQFPYYYNDIKIR